MSNKVQNIFSIFEKENSAPQTELNYHNSYTLLVAVILSAQATDKGVNIATKDLFEKYDSPQKILELGLDGLKHYVKTLNYYHTKSKNIIATSQILLDKYKGNVPDNMEALLTLPGVGRKTASVVLGVAFNKASMPVDTHVFRVANRLGIAAANNPHMMEIELIKVIPEKWLYNAHHWLVLHGRYVCKARKPLCMECKLSDYCDYYTKSVLTI